MTNNKKSLLSSNIAEYSYANIRSCSTAVIYGSKV